MSDATYHGERLDAAQERYYLASQWTLMWQKFRRHHMAIAGGAVLVLFYLVALFCDFFTPYGTTERFQGLQNHPPSRIRLLHDGRLVRPYVYRTEAALDLETFESTFTELTEVRYPIRLFIRGQEYQVLG